jgi:hypothetical protein
MAKKKPIIDPLAGTMGALLAKPRGTTTDAIINPTVAATVSPTDTLATFDPLARYTGASGSKSDKYKDKLPGFTTAEFPDWTPQDLEALYRTSKDFDTRFFNTSDARFAADHPSLARGNRDLERLLSMDMSGGNARLSPAVRDAALQTGLEGALGSFGDTPGNFRNSAKEAAVARDLFGPEGILGFQEANRRRAIDSAQVASVLFPHRQIGFSGDTAVQIAAGNIDNQNTYGFARYADQVGKDVFNWQINAQNLNQAIEQRNAMAQAIADRQNAAATTAAGDKASKTATRNAAIGAGAAILGAVVIAF